LTLGKPRSLLVGDLIDASWTVHPGEIIDVLLLLERYWPTTGKAHHVIARPQTVSHRHASVEYETLAFP
jgi:hypothetical protein